MAGAVDSEILGNDSIVVDDSGWVKGMGNERVVVHEGTEGDEGFEGVEEAETEDEGVFFYSDYDMSEDDRLFEKYVDVGVEGNEYISGGMYNRLQDGESEEDCVGSDDEFASGEKEKMKHTMYNPRNEGKNPEIKLGLIFSCKEEAKFAIESHCLRKGMMVRFQKNDKKRLRIVCKKEGCTWYVQDTILLPLQKSWHCMASKVL
ncbi:hypothetical protein Salat_1840700 [Sesamum alatum]|uniref:Transposase MuDR plant domain-containing protein n=1 Tax=Sesamum alatum TaxID=300844 RepID=A0AAE2CHS4_9LAMI|nr:hypothetical protein Salat_1840700 [Sesamum alatum]